MNRNFNAAGVSGLPGGGKGLLFFKTYQSFCAHEFVCFFVFFKGSCYWTVVFANINGAIVRAEDGSANSRGLSAGVVVAIAIAATVIGVAIIAIAATLYFKRRQQKNSAEPSFSAMSTDA